MNKESVRIAFAVNANNFFEEKHFSKSNTFLIYEWGKKELALTEMKINSFITDDEGPDGILSDNCNSITDLLNKLDVKVLVSRKFGKSVQMVNHLFIPVIVNSETPAEVVSILKKHFRWIEEELNSKPDEYKLFTIRGGILKTAINKEN
jgi:hypothetical protein